MTHLERTERTEQSNGVYSSLLNRYSPSGVSSSLMAGRLCVRIRN